MRALLVQPPLVQLNSPYPAIHYLAAFLRARGHEVNAVDHSIELYRLIFSRPGLERIFADASNRLRERQAGTDEPSRNPDSAEGRELDRYFSSAPLYLEWVDGLVAFLSGEDPAMAHRLAAAVELPRGARASLYLEARDGRIVPDEARGLATAILEDLSDFIRHALDPDFGTVRYGERVARSRGSFDGIETGLRESYVIDSFYRPWLETSAASGTAIASPRATAPDILLVTIPFPGCLLGALACARAARKAFGPKLRIAFGGGYVSTELRGLSDRRIFDYCDWMSFDAGFGSLASILEAEGLEGPRSPGKSRNASVEAPLYRTMRRESDRVLAIGFPDGADAPSVERRAIPREDTARFEALEREALSGVFPDYADADMGRYLRVVDSANPMHRLWSDTPWLKFHLAHGCYWRKCAFCDVELDYVANFLPTEVAALERAADLASAKKGLYGIHFVDEAMPISRLLSFARANRSRAARGLRPFSFWGNVRFDSSWTAGRCEFLAASGLVAASGGIEIATESGLAATDKGFDLAGLVRTLVAMKRSGLLVHAYLIYGFPGQDPRDIVDSAETLRQFFVSGLVDSAFWHRFVLTRHSRLAAEWRAGGQPGLKPIDRGGDFAANDLEFEGEEAFDRFAAPLDASLAAWMEGAELERPAATWFEGTGHRSGIKPGFVESLIVRAEAALDSEIPTRGQAQWIAGLPLEGGDASRLRWAYRGEMEELRLSPPAASRLAAAIRLAARPEGIELAAFISEAGLEAKGPTFAAISRSGLVLV